MLAFFYQRQASLLNSSTPSARPEKIHCKGGTIEFETTPGLAASFSVPWAAIAISAMQNCVSVDLPSIFRHFFCAGMGSSESGIRAIGLIRL